MAANAQTIQVGLQMTADTSQAKRELENLQKSLTRLMNTSTTSDKDFLGLEKTFASAKGKIAELQVMLKNSTNSDGILNLNTFSQQMSLGKSSIADYQKALSSMGDAGKRAFNQFADSALKGTVQLEKGNGVLAKFSENLVKVASWQLSSSIIHGFMTGISQAMGYAKSLDESLNNIRIVTGKSTEEMAAFAVEANKAAQSLSTTTTAYTDASLIYYQQGA